MCFNYLEIITVGGVTVLCYQRQNRNSHNDGVQRNPSQFHKWDNKGSDTNKQNRIQHEDGKSQENVHESNLDEKLSCLVEGSTSIIMQRANAIATENLKIEFQRLKFCWILNPNKHLPQNS